MPLVPLQTNSGPNTSLFAPAGSGGGGGGGGPNLVVSTIRFPDGTVSNDGALFSLSNQSTLSLSSDGSTFLGLKPTLNAILVDGDPIANALGANLIAGGIGLIGQGGQFNTQIPAFLNGNGAGSVMVSSILVSTINGAAPGGGVNPLGISTNQIAAASGNTLILRTDISNTQITIASDKGGVVEVIAGSALGTFKVNAQSTITSGDLYTNTLTASTINNRGFTMEVFQTGVATLDAGGSTIIETDYIFAITDPVPQATYRGTVGAGVSSLGAISLSPSTFIVYGEPNTGINWLAAGS